MADKKISALTASTTPLAGTEVLPIVQSGSTVQVSVANLTAGRAISANGLTSTANIRTEYAAAGNVTTITSNTSSAAGAAAQLYNVNDASRALRIQYSSSGGAGGAALTNGISTETAQIFTDGNFPIVLGTNVSAALILDTSQNAKIINNLIVGTAGKGIDFTANGGDVLTQYDEGDWTPNQGAGLTVVGAFSSSGKYTRIGRQVTVTGQVNGATSVLVSASGVISTNLPFTSGVNTLGIATNSALSVVGGVFVSSGTTTLSATVAIGATSTIYFQVTYFV